MVKITKQEVINRLLEHDTFETKKAVGEVLDLLLGTITESIAAGNEVHLGNAFGTFKPAIQAARDTGFGPSPEKKVIRFKPSAALKATIAGA